MTSLRAFAAKARGKDLAGPPIVLDMEGLPHSPCPACGGLLFHQEPGKPWRCDACAPSVPPAPENQDGWCYCALPPEGELGEASRAGGP